MAQRNSALPWLLAGGALLLIAAAGGVAIYSGALFPSDWLARGAAYVPYLSSIEDEYGLPQNLLAAVAYQESGFNPSAVNPSSGAVGMFQLEPQFYPGAGADWEADAQAAASSLAAYFARFGDWTLALASYNWGPGNVSSYVASSGAVASLPSETYNYIARVRQATGVTGMLS